MVSRDNFLLFTPMLPEVTSRMIETRHIVTPVRLFCKEKAKFREANVKSIDLDKKEVIITYPIGKQSHPTSLNQRILKYDYLVIALGSENNLFGRQICYLSLMWLYSKEEQKNSTPST
jgi:NADH dehydrogenase